MTDRNKTDQEFPVIRAFQLTQSLIFHYIPYFSQAFYFFFLLKDHLNFLVKTKQFYEGEAWDGVTGSRIATICFKRLTYCSQKVKLKVKPFTRASCGLYTIHMFLIHCSLRLDNGI